MASVMGLLYVPHVAVEKIVCRYGGAVGHFDRSISDKVTLAHNALAGVIAPIYPGYHTSSPNSKSDLASSRIDTDPIGGHTVLETVTPRLSTEAWGRP